MSSVLVATLVSDPSKAPLSEATVERAAQALNGIERWRWLDEGVAADLVFTGDLKARRAALEGALGDEPVDIIVQPLAHRRKRLLVADMDSTLIGQECLDELAGEADGLWSARRAKHRKFYVAEDKLKQAQDTLRELMLTANKWRELKRAYEGAERAYSEIDEQIRETGAERNRLSRIRRVIRDVRNKQELDNKLAALGEDIKANGLRQPIVFYPQLVSTGMVGS